MDLEDVWDLLITLALAAVVVVIIRIALNYIKKILYQKARSSLTQWDDFIYDLLNNTKNSVITIWAISSIAFAVNLDNRILSFLKILMVVATTLQVVIWSLRSIRGWRDRKLKKIMDQDVAASAPIGLISSVAEALVIIVFIMVGLSNLGVNIGALIAGLGIGGVAVALAAQNILGDLFASFSILFDKPFIIGDFILVGQDMGTVENIGLKTTRVKSLTGEQLIFSNKDLLESRIRNFKRMRERRVVQKLRVSFQTQVRNLEKIPTWVQETIAKKDKVRFEYCCLTEIGEYAYVFEVVFWMLDPDYLFYLKTQESFYHEIIDRIHGEKVCLAVPTNAILLEPQCENEKPRNLEPSLL